MFFELVSILFAIVPDYGNKYKTKENENWTSLKNFAPKLNLTITCILGENDTRSLAKGEEQVEIKRMLFKDVWFNSMKSGE